jgi:hypothetical protein
MKKKLFSLLRRCSLGCAEFGQCKAAMHGKPRECARGVTGTSNDQGENSLVQ